MTRESEVQAAVRLEMARRGYRLWRNNSGVLRNENGTPVRYGLGNDSHQVNARLKSSDLIGWHRVVITPGMVGLTIAQFVTLECKPGDWRDTSAAMMAKYGPRPFDRRDLPDDVRRILAQKAWIDLVAGDGGEARFVTGV